MPPKAIRTGRIRVGQHTLLCYVLNDERRVLDAADLRGFFGFPDAITPAEAPTAVRALIEDVQAFALPSGETRHGYTADTLTDVAHAVIKATDAQTLTAPWATHALARAKNVFQAFPALGITALADESSGYQRTRASDALQTRADRLTGVKRH